MTVRQGGTCPGERGGRKTGQNEGIGLPRCPLCKEPLETVHEEYLDSLYRNVLLEQVLSCPNGCYELEYAYGAHRELWAPWWRRYPNFLWVWFGRVYRRFLERWAVCAGAGYLKKVWGAVRTGHRNRLGEVHDDDFSGGRPEIEKRRLHDGDRAWRNVGD